MKPNIETFLHGQEKYFANSYTQFLAFGGPCVYFHLECLRAGNESFLSKRHIEFLYATLTAWGLHRMGNSTTKTKLTDWESFYGSIVSQSNALQDLRHNQMLHVSMREYSEAVLRLQPLYNSLRLSISDATIVVNSKALHHLCPSFIPPIDRQYTMRFFQCPPQQWRDAKGKFRPVQLPKGADAQFSLFHETCVEMKSLADSIDPALFNEQRERHGVAAPKALDNAIVNYVRIVSGGLPEAE